MDLNVVALVGRLSRDPELKYLTDGTAVANCGLAVSGLKTDKGEEVVFVDFSAFSKTAEFVAQYLDKGAKVSLVGRLKFDQWHDRETGDKRTKLAVVASTVQGLETKAEADARRAKSGQAAPGGEADDGAADDGDEGDYEGFPTS